MPIYEVEGEKGCRAELKVSGTFFDESCLIMTGFDSVYYWLVFCLYGSESVTLTGSRCNPDENQWNSRNTPPLPDDVVEFSFIIADAGAHLGLEGFHGKDFNTNVDLIKKARCLTNRS